MKRRLVVFAAAPAAAAPAAAGLRGLHGRKYVLGDGRTGQVPARYHARARVPSASVTKPLTVLRTPGHTSPSDVVAVTRRPAGFDARRMLDESWGWV